MKNSVDADHCTFFSQCRPYCTFLLVNGRRWLTLIDAVDIPFNYTFHHALKFDVACFSFFVVQWVFFQFSIT